MRCYLLYRSVEALGPNSIRVAPHCYVRAVEIEAENVVEALGHAEAHRRIGEDFINSIPTR